MGALDPSGVGGVGAEAGKCDPVSKVREHRKRDPKHVVGDAAASSGTGTASKVEEKSEEALEWIMAALQKKAPFTDMPLAQLRLVATGMSQVKVPEGEEVVKEGETGDVAYLLEDGALVVLVGGKAVDTIIAGAVFGEVRHGWWCRDGA